MHPSQKVVDMTIDRHWDLRGKKVLVTGHRGMVGSAIVRNLEKRDCTILTAGRAEADLRRQADTENLIANLRPDAIIIAAAKVGGILANNNYPAEFLYDNLTIASNLIEAAHKADLDRLVFLGSSCIYPKLALQPISEMSLLTGPLEPTNEWYAIAKIAGIKLCQAYRHQYGRDYISAMPTILYGPNDTFDLASSHVLPALMRKAHEAKLSNKTTLEIWGTGAPLREFLHADDCADAIVFLLERYSDNMHINVGYGEDISILDLARKVCAAVGFEGEIITDKSKPDGTPRKLMASDRLRKLGWSPTIDLEAGVASTYKWFQENVAGSL
jgi:GDP-L-fucose synthase